MIIFNFILRQFIFKILYHILVNGKILNNNIHST